MPLLCGVMLNGDQLVFRKLSESNSQKKREIFERLVSRYGSAESIPLEAWRDVLTPDRYRVTRLNVPEPSHGEFTKNNSAPGNYSCTCCGVLLFESTDKFGMSPYLTFTRGNDKNIECITTSRFHTKITEIKCRNCYSHLGQLFKDPSNNSICGNAYTINSLALDFNLEKFQVALRKSSIQSV